MFDPEWATNGHLDKVVTLFTNWIKQQNIEGLTHEVVRLEKRTPVIFVEVQATKKENVSTVLLYGHMDKQPPLESGWMEGLHPYKPVIRDGKLYGRGGADDGYALFGALTAIQAVKKQNIPHDRYVVLIEACEESGSFDLPFYIEHLKERIAVPSLIVCLDSGCGNYEQLWMTSSLRGMVTGVLKVEILKEGVHSGHATGIVPSTFRIARSLLERIENVNDGTIVNDFHVVIPAHRVEQAKYCADVLGNSVHEEFPFVDGAGPISHDNVKLLLNRSWSPALAITGVEGIPALQNAGNVLRPYTALKLSLRLPPTLPAVTAANHLKEILEKDIPYEPRPLSPGTKRVLAGNPLH
jgi:acetylornithine deacetylase/succinyl-diaminopimelate desuccinylase-like protein